MKACAKYRRLDFVYPIQVEPKWAPLIERWYQLDAFAYGLAEAYYTLREDKETHPDFVYLASAGSSNQTDFSFASAGASSPSKFVHTLPNIRGSSLFQLMAYKGPLLCIQNDPSTLVTAIREALDMLNCAHERIWIWSVSGNYTVHWFEISRPSDNSIRENVIEFHKRPSTSQESELPTDQGFLQWLDERKSISFILPGNYVSEHQINN